MTLEDVDIADIDAALERKGRMIDLQLARLNYIDFVEYVNPKYETQPFHQVMAGHLQLFAEGKIKKLMITCPPQHGKSELSTRNFPAYLFGLRPDLKIAVLSYAADKATKFSREIQQRIDSDEYSEVFPFVRLATARDEGLTKTQKEFDIVGTGGSLKAVGRRGALTGDPVDIAILDDLIKDQVEAQSPTIREQAWGWLETVVDTRFHNDSQILYVTTRWHQDDPAGRFLDQDGYYSEDNPDGWVLLNFPALKTPDVNDYDDRAVGEALWPQKHSKAKMLKKQRDSELTFNALYQGDPKPSSKLTIFYDWAQIDEYPDHLDEEFIGLDFGFSNDPTAATRIGITGRNIYLDELFYETDMTNQDIIDQLHLTGLPATIDTICDKAEPKSIEEIRRGYYKPGNVFMKGFNARGCEKGPGSINAGILKLKEYNVFYTKRSRNIKAERDNYTWITQGGKATNTPIGQWNHALDGIRSAVFTRKGKPQGGNTTAKRVQAKKGRTY
ncbi:terminase large subunit [Spirosoma radiotolerans]|uniref:terminase large subunit n=1 Tax=Spirosoma radiotolerans TaxID=1379870 RepID=UPI000696FEFD|nr:terminase large subunit [Spirosoma radiotolerans]